MTHRDEGWFTRREVLGMLGAGAVALGGRVPRDAWPASGHPAAGGLDCVVTPAQTEGPYFVDERLHRADIRPDPATGRVSEGLPLRLRVAVARVDGAACTPLPDAMVDIWQCDALGLYSDVRDANGRFDTRGQQFLRGYQLTDRAGVAEFVTVYPGWYQGRTVHIHFKIRVAGAGARQYEFTSQWYFDEAITDQVHARPPYAARGPRTTRNEQDGIFRRERGRELLLRLSPLEAGYLGAFAVGLRMA